jgi:ubiquinone/menaquinone biosynthesis C-methylase UbiE
MAHAGKFWDRIAKRYARSPVADEAAYQHKLQVTRDHLEPETELLEIGCGTGSTAITHAPYVHQIRAVDISEKMLAFARDKAAAAHVKNIRFEQAAIDEIELPDARYDVVLALSILHLLEDRDVVIDRIYQALRPGGFFISSTACLGDKMGYFKFIAPLGKMLGLLPVLRVFTSQEMEDSLKRAGFEISYRWQTEPGKALFIVAGKAGS